MQGKKALIIVMILTMILSMIPLSSVGAASPADSITISDPRSMAYYNGYIYVAQRGPGKISRISTTTGQVSDVLVMSTGSSPMAVAINSQGDLFYTKDSNKNVFKISAASLTSLPLNASQVNTLSQSYFLGDLNYIYGLTFDANDNLFMTDYITKGIYRLDLGQTVPTAVITGASQAINGIAFNTNGDLYFVDDWEKAYKIDKADLTVKSATDPTKIKFLESTSNPAANGVIFLPDGTHYISSLSSGVIVKHTFASESAITVAKNLLPSSLTVTEGTITNLLTYLNGLSGMSATGVTLSLTSSNANVANNGAITFTSTAVTGNVSVIITKAGETQDTKTIAVTVPAHTPTPAELANASIAAAKALLPSSLTVTEGTYTNLLTYLNGLSGMSATGVTLSLTSSNANVANDGTITYTSAAVTGNVTVLINKANGTQATKTIAVTVAAHTLTPAELANASIASAKALLPSSLTVTEGTYTNLLTYLNGLSGMSDTGVTLTLVSSNANVANNGAITHTSAAVTGNVTVMINKANGAQETRTIAVNVSPLPVQVTVTSLSVDAANANITINGVKQLAVSAAYSNNTTADVTATASYSTSNGNVAIVSAAGAITAVGFGSADITVSYSGQSKVVAVTVPRPASHSSSSTGASTPAAPATDAKQPEDKAAPTVPSTQPAITDVFKSDAVKTDSSVVNRISTRVENANRAEVKIQFSDIQQHWANKTIDTFIKLNIIEGYNDGKFRPDGAITRAEFAVIIDRVFGINNDLKQSVVMNDIRNHWAKDTLEKLSNAGILNGYGQEFRPDQTVTRAEMVTIISRIVNMNTVKKNESNGAFSDTSNSFASSQIQEAAQTGIVTGKEGNNFKPDAQSTRAEALTIIMNTLNLSPQIKTLLDSLK
ncbi:MULTISPECIES: S-layer homology domain-containing protein [unclassified Paenibacillus]|uniref:S-layer homology domain-containing protein n=1 Tax=unclassified Paenibacillus TaxID=185978 RepID=UPI003624D83C